MIFGGCPRCRGDIELLNDMYGDYYNCLQCSYMQDVPKEDIIIPSVKKKQYKQYRRDKPPLRKNFPTGREGYGEFQRIYQEWHHSVNKSNKKPIRNKV